MKRALVTGGSGDIGAAICQRLAQDGIHVIVHANQNREKAQLVAEKIRGSGGSAEITVFDVTDRNATAHRLDHLVDTGCIQILINNAGIHHDVLLAAMHHDDWDRIFDVSVNGFFNVTQPLLMPMIQSRWGRIINMSSVSAVIGNRGQVNYSAAKSALHGATKSLARELGSRGVTVNAIAPGVIEGRMTEDVFDKESIRSLVPMERAGTPGEVAALAAFLCTEEAGYISGQIIGVNGAMV